MIYDHLVGALRSALADLGVEAPAKVSLERPARREHGDWSSNVALAVAKAAGRKPRDLAQQLADHLSSNPPVHVLKVEVAGPGFVNFYLADTWLHDVLADVVAAGIDGFGGSDEGAGTRVNVEFVSANPNGPLHAGHGRGAIYGDTIARLLARRGYDVTREYYLNDRGVQMRNYANSLAARKHGQPLPEDGYAGQYVVDWAAEMPDDADPLEWGYAKALADQREVLDVLRINFDVWTSERELMNAGSVEAALDDLRRLGMVFDDDGAVWLASTRFGDDKDRVLIKSDGSYTYLTPDIAYHRNKFERGFDLLIDVLGADHHGYVPRMKAAVQALGHDPAELEMVITQLVKLVRGGEEVKLGKRSGNIVELRDVVEEIGADATRFTYLLQSVDTKQTFDLALAKSQEMDNPVFYVQMAHARVRSLERFAAERGVTRQPFAGIDVTRLNSDRELDILRALVEFDDVMRAAVELRAPHRVVAWLRELATAFHGFYHDCKVVGDDVDAAVTQARLWLAEATRIGLRAGLDVIGVSAPESM